VNGDNTAQAQKAVGLLSPLCPATNAQWKEDALQATSLKTCDKFRLDLIGSLYSLAPPFSQIAYVRLSENCHMIARSCPSHDIRRPTLPFRESIFLLWLIHLWCQSGIRRRYQAYRIGITSLRPIASAKVGAERADAADARRVPAGISSLTPSIFGNFVEARR
jgi:hypothetical protein